MISDLHIPGFQGKNAPFLRRAVGGRLLRLAMVFVAVLAAVAGLTVPRSAAIINGNTPATAPSWAVALLGLEAGNGSRCSGVLIAPNLVLTAQHCQGPLGETPTVVIGRSDINAVSTGRVALAVATYPHPSTDLAVMQLDEPVKQAPIEISLEDVGSGLTGIPHTVYGYGRINDKPEKAKLDDLLHSAVGLVAECPSDAPMKVTLCLKAASIQAVCDGDSGGPVVNPQGQLTGIMAYVFDDGLYDSPCLGELWGAVVTGGSVSDWLHQIIDKYGRNPAS
jgi:secreted trypsin-like serine protease